LVANPIKFSKTSIQYQKAPPLLGADTQQVLQTSLQYTEDEIAQLRALGVIG
jgi:crotonobetainyl-CoA:carnitine CoA-transferase CaiB-like acyl-CoA transferase